MSDFMGGNLSDDMQLQKALYYFSHMCISSPKDILKWWSYPLCEPQYNNVKAAQTLQTLPGWLFYILRL